MTALPYCIAEGATFCGMAREPSEEIFAVVIRGSMPRNHTHAPQGLQVKYPEEAGRTSSTVRFYHVRS